MNLHDQLKNCLPRKIWKFIILGTLKKEGGEKFKKF